MILYPDQMQKNIVPVMEKIKEKGWETLVPDDEVELNGKKLSLQAYYQIRNRDPKNIHVVELKTKIMESMFEKIEKSDAILVFNLLDKTTGMQISPQMFLGMSVAFYLKKDIYTFDHISNTLPYRDEIQAMHPKVITRNIDNITPVERAPIGFIQETQEVVNSDLGPTVRTTRKPKLKIKKS
ncbi:MAG: hypothetical protein RBR32_03655 [Bacteroidales bacterium]|nr:hypothetical protein [Bacteroidales bacterium]